MEGETTIFSFNFESARGANEKKKEHIHKVSRKTKEKKKREKSDLGWRKITIEVNAEFKRLNVKENMKLITILDWLPKVVARQIVSFLFPGKRHTRKKRGKMEKKK